MYIGDQSTTVAAQFLLFKRAVCLLWPLWDSAVEVVSKGKTLPGFGLHCPKMTAEAGAKVFRDPQKNQGTTLDETGSGDP